MAITNLQLNVRANTARAMADFKRFSANLDNQFLVSGLKLDVVRSALGQINREFMKSIGEQGLIGASSLRAAQNQAAMMAQIFKGFTDETSINITTQLSTALNNVAVKAGGTMKDVQRTLAATPFISRDLSEDLRLQLTKGIMTFQRDFRRAGIGDNFGGIAQQFLAGQTTGRDLISTKDPLSTFLGSEIIKRSDGQGFIDNPLKRAELLLEVINDPKIVKQLKEMSVRTAGFRIVLEDLNTQLFNTESGVFGSLRKVIDRTGKQVTMFDEVDKLVKQVFGENGFFRSLFKSISEIFNIEDPLRPLIDAVQFMTGIFGKLTSFVQSDRFKTILFFVEDTFYRLREFFTNVYKSVKEAIPTDAFDRVINVFKDLRQQITSGSFDSSNITRFITDLGEGIREYIRKIGNSIRERDDTKEMGFVAEIGVTLLTEVGKTAIVLVKELLMTLIDKAPEIATSVLPALNKGINSLLTEAFGEVGGKIVKFIAGFIPHPVGMIARASAIGDVTGGGGNMFSALAMGAGALLGPGALFGGAGILRALTTSRGRFGMLNRFGNQAMKLETSLNRRFLLDDPLTGANRFSPLSRGIIDPLSARIRPTTQFASVIPDPFPAALASRVRDYNQQQSLMRGLSQGRLPQFNRVVPPRQNIPASYDIEAGRRFIREREARRTQDMFDQVFRDTKSRLTTPAPTPPTPYIRPFFTLQEINSRYRRRYGIGANLRRGFSDANIHRFPADLLLEGGFIQGTDASNARPGYDFGGQKDANLAARFNRRYGSGGARAVIGRNFGRMASRVGRIGLIGAGVTALVFGGGRGQAAEIDPETGMPKPNAMGAILGGAGKGALEGASIGMMLGPKGALAGAAIGAVIGGIAPLFDKGVREGVEVFVNGIKDGFSRTLTWFIKGTQENFDRAKTLMGSVTTNAVNGLIFIFNGIISGFQILPRLIMSLVESAYEKIPGKEFIPGLKGLVEGGRTIANFQIPTIKNNYSGEGFAGPALALEARMSGANPIQIMNDREFGISSKGGDFAVIPNNGFATLAGLVGQNLRNSDVVRQADGPTQINVNLTVQTSAFYADAEQIARELKNPVLEIVNQAWTEYADSRRVIRSKIN